MKLLLVSSTDSIRPFLDEIFVYQQVDIIHYANPIKAMDNLEELRPEVIVFSATDYPRHWKPFVVFLRSSLTRHDSVFILMINDAFPADEAAKAEYLEVNAVLDEDLTSPQTMQRVRAIVRRYHQSFEGRKFQRLTPATNDHVGFAFTNPYTMSVVFGRVIDLSLGGLQLEPYNRSMPTSIDSFEPIDYAVLQLERAYLTVRARLVRVGQTFAFEFVDLSATSEQANSDFVDRRMSGVLEAGYVDEGNLDTISLTTATDPS